MQQVKSIFICTMALQATKPFELAYNRVIFDSI
jgi:hypothetical protein